MKRQLALSFPESPLAHRAVQGLREESGFRFRSPGFAAAEVGVRLMQSGQYRELGVSRAEARALAAEYMQTLEKELWRNPRNHASMSSAKLPHGLASKTSPKASPCAIKRRPWPLEDPGTVLPNGKTVIDSLGD